MLVKNHCSLKINAGFEMQLRLMILLQELVLRYT